MANNDVSTIGNSTPRIRDADKSNSKLGEPPKGLGELEYAPGSPLELIATMNPQCLSEGEWGLWQFKKRIFAGTVHRESPWFYRCSTPDLVLLDKVLDYLRNGGITAPSNYRTLESGALVAEWDIGISLCVYLHHALMCAISMPHGASRFSETDTVLMKGVQGANDNNNKRDCLVLADDDNNDAYLPVLRNSFEQMYNRILFTV